MKQPETKFKERVLKQLRALPGTWWEKIQQSSIRGTPDIIGCVEKVCPCGKFLYGEFNALELKRSEKAKVDELQLHKIELIKSARGNAVVCHPKNWDEVYDDIWRGRATNGAGDGEDS